MRQSGWSMALAVCGTVIGAGFASGREIGVFFSCFGTWSLAAMAAAVAVTGLLASRMLVSPGVNGMPESWRKTPMERCWQALFTLLLITTGGAMLSGSGEIAALLLPVRHARRWGLLITFALGLLLTRKGRNTLPVFSAALTLGLTGMIVLGLRLPCGAGARLAQKKTAPEAVLSGVCYGGLNMALAVPVMARGVGSDRERKRAVRLICVVLGVLLFCGNALLLRHPEASDAPMPLILILRAYGTGSYRLCGVTLYLAVFTTLLASMQGLRGLCAHRRRAFPAAAIALAFTALVSFERITAILYPLLGGLCFALLALSAACAPRGHSASSASHSA